MLTKLKNVIKNPKSLSVILINKMHFLSDKMYLKLRYYIEFGKRFNLKDPKTFNEKLNWLKLNDRNLTYSSLVDKYEVRNYIKEKLGEEYLIPLLGVWDNFDEIDFDSLPNQFVIKCTHDSGSVVICKDKSTFDIEKAKSKINSKMKKNLYWWAREWVYKDLKPRIIAEKYMEDSICKELRDYKFFCFNGDPKYIYISRNLSNHSEGEISFYDMDFNRAPFYRTDFKPIKEDISKPEKFDEMKRLAAQLSKDTRFLRVDFYEVDGHIYFGELTFYPAGGYMPFEPAQWDEELGKMLNLE